MTIKSDKWIRHMAKTHGMIEPFEPDQIREKDNQRIVSYGTSSYGYDIRCSDEFKLFTNINSMIVDPKNFDSNSFVYVKRLYTKLMRKYIYPNDTRQLVIPNSKQKYDKGSNKRQTQSLKGRNQKRNYKKCADAFQDCQTIAGIHSP